ncbi:IS5 family transposase [uncultured Lamprocystis sp.]|jgi:putative transposase|uniref:IS5 family transposase n=1 Tax=uncultured Lamprocystis sp. TaxID=543132 RepID=UPI0025FDDFB9|nr:IS5 family transposase [uncultured Lamprocystis sp.]
MMYREIPDEFWNAVEPLLAPFRRTKSGGSPPLDFRLIVNGIFYVLKTGCQWSMLPRCYGSKSTVHEHFQRWVHAGVWAELFRRYAQAYQDLKGVQWDWQAMDGTLVQAPVRGQTRCLAAEGLGPNPTDRGRSGSKLHLHVDQHGIPLGIALVGANVHDSRLVSPTLVLDILPRPTPNAAHPQHLCLDKGFDYARVDAEVVGHGYLPHIRRIGEEKTMRGGTTQPARRWVVERTIAWLKGFRAIRTRYCCRATNYLAMIHLACALILSRKLAAA